MVTKWSPSGHQVVTKYSSNSQQKQQVVTKWSYIFIYFHPISSTFIHFHPLRPFSPTFIHLHPFSFTFIHFHPLHPFHPLSSISTPFLSTSIHFYQFSFSFIHFYPHSSTKCSASGRQVVGKWLASGRQVVGKWSQLVKVCSGIESFGTLKPISGRDGWMDGWDGYIEHYVC